MAKIPQVWDGQQPFWEWAQELLRETTGSMAGTDYGSAERVVLHHFNPHHQVIEEMKAEVKTLADTYMPPTAAKRVKELMAAISDANADIEAAMFDAIHGQGLVDGLYLAGLLQVQALARTAGVTLPASPRIQAVLEWAQQRIQAAVQPWLPLEEIREHWDATNKRAPASERVSPEEGLWLIEQGIRALGVPQEAVSHLTEAIYRMLHTVAGAARPIAQADADQVQRVVEESTKSNGSTVPAKEAGAAVAGA